MADFVDFYSLYPRKKSRGDAEKAWKQALKKGFSPEDIISGLSRNLSELQQREPQFVPYPATWIRSESFFDEPDPIAKRSSRRTIVDAANDFNASHGHIGDAFGLPGLHRH